MAETSADRLAAFIIARADRRGIKLTNLKLQKLLYYCQAWHLAILDRALFDDPIEAWVHGPVVPAVFRKYREHRWNPLPAPETMPDVQAGPAQRPIDQHVSEVLDSYGSLSGRDLETLSHRELPWLGARVGMPADAPGTNVISHDSMRDYFKKQLA